MARKKTQKPDDHHKTTTTPRKVDGRQIDALAKWTTEAVAATASVEEIRLDQNDRLLVPFTLSIEEVTLHYLDYPSMPGYVHCNGDGCLLCRIGRKTDKRDVWPIYDVIARTVGVLPISTNMRPQALRPQLIPVMQRLAAGERMLLAMQKIDKYRYTVTILELQKNADDGAAQIAEFLEKFKAGTINLASVIPTLSNDVIAALPEVAIIMKSRGVQP